MSSGTQASGEQERDSADLARFGYSQELKRSLGLFSSFAVAFSYISPSTGIFTLFALGLTSLDSHHSFSVVTNSAGIPVNGSTFLAAMFMSLFVIYGFDTASTLSEETKDPRRAAPKAVLYSVIGAFIIGGVFLLGVLVAIPNMGDAVKGAFGPAAIIEANFSTPFATIYLLVVSAAVFVCCLSIMAATIRLCFGMARDNQLPGSSFLAKVSPSPHTPIGRGI